MADPDQKDERPKRRMPSKSFLDRMTSADADPAEYEAERQAAIQKAEAEAKGNKA